MIVSGIKLNASCPSPLQYMKCCDTGKPWLHLICDMWDAMIEKVRKAIYSHKQKEPEEDSTFYTVVHTILVD